MKYPLRFALLCFPLSLLFQPASFAESLASSAYGTDSGLWQGIKKYEQGFYTDALTALNNAHYDKKNAAEAHYYKGMALQKLGKALEAARELKLATLFDKEGRIRNLAQNALNGTSNSSGPSSIPNSIPISISNPSISFSGSFSIGSSPSGSSHAGNGFTNSASNSWQNICGAGSSPNPIYTPARMSSSEQEVRDCARRIMNQSTERIGNVWKEYTPNRREEYLYQGDDIPGRPITRYPPNLDWAPTPRCPPLYPSITSGRNPYRWDGRYKFHPGSISSLPYNDPQRLYLQDKAKHVAESADGLISLLTRKDDGKGVFLVPEGTNLYVRNYEFGAPIDPPPPVGKKTDVPMLSLPKPLTQRISPLASNKI